MNKEREYWTIGKEEITMERTEIKKEQTKDYPIHVS